MSFLKGFKKTDSGPTTLDRGSAARAIGGFLRRAQDRAAGSAASNSVSSRHSPGSKEHRPVSSPSEPVKLVLKSGEFYTAPIRATGFPENVPGTFKWYRIEGSEQKFVSIDEVTTQDFHASVTDVGLRLCCQWIPDDGGFPSSFAESGPLKMDPQIADDAQTMYATGSSDFVVDIPTFSDETQLVALRDDRITVRPQSKPDSKGVSMRIRGDFKAHLPPGKRRELTVKNSQGTIILQGTFDSSKSRDVFALVVERMAKFDAKSRKSKGKKSQRAAVSKNDVVSLEINIVKEGDILTPGQLSKKLQQTQFDLMNLRKENETFKNRQAAVLSELESVRGVRQLQSTQLSETTERNIELEKDNEDLKSTNLALQKKHSLAEKELREKKSTFKDTEERCALLTTRVNELASANEDMAAKLSSKVNVLDGVMTEHQAANQDVEDLKKTLSSTNTVVLELTENNQKLLDTIEKQQRELEKLTKKRETAQKEVSSLTTQISTLETDNSQLTTSIDDLNRVIKEGYSRESELEDKVAELEDQVADFESTKLSLKERNQLNSDIRERMRAVQKQLQLEQQNSFKHENQYQTLLQKHETLQTKHATTSQRLEAALTRLNTSVSKSDHQKLLAKYEALLNSKEQTEKDLRQEHERALRSANESSATKAVASSVPAPTAGVSKDRVQQYAVENQKLLSERNFWKQKADGMSKDIKKLISSQKRRESVSSYNSEQVSRMETETEAMRKERDQALQSLNAFRNAYEQQQHRLDKATKLKVHMGDDKSKLHHKNNQLQQLANTLSDALSDRDQEIRSLKQVSKLLGDRVRDLEAFHKVSPSEKLPPAPAPDLGASPAARSTSLRSSSSPSRPRATPTSATSSHSGTSLSSRTTTASSISNTTDNFSKPSSSSGLSASSSAASHNGVHSHALQSESRSRSSSGQSLSSLSAAVPPTDNQLSPSNHALRRTSSTNSTPSEHVELP